MSFSLNKPSLIVMDYQNIILNTFIPPETSETCLENTQKIIKAAREKGIPVIYVMVGFTEGHPEVHANNSIFSYIKSAELFTLDNSHTDIHENVKPLKNDKVIIKHRVGAFSGTSLDMFLKSNSIDTLIMAGLTTAGVVLTSVRQAFDLDYRVAVVEDCCADANPEKHNMLINKVIADHAQILTSKEVTELFVAHQ